jgi:hypothetical protein
MRKRFYFRQIKTVRIIAPEKILLEKVQAAFRLIKKIDSKEYQKLFSRLSVVFITNKYGGTNEFFMPEKIWFANKSVVTKNDTVWLASLILHEAFHATQFKNGSYVLPFGPQLEKPALELQDRFLKKAGDLDHGRGTAAVYRKKYWEEMGKDKTSYAYFRNLLELLEEGKLVLTKA